MKEGITNPFFIKNDNGKSFVEYMNANMQDTKQTQFSDIEEYKKYR